MRLAELDGEIDERAEERDDEKAEALTEGGGWVGAQLDEDDQLFLSRLQARSW